MSATIAVDQAALSAVIAGLRSDAQDADALAAGCPSSPDAGDAAALLAKMLAELTGAGLKVLQSVTALSDLAAQAAADLASGDETVGGHLDALNRGLQ